MAPFFGIDVIKDGITERMALQNILKRDRYRKITISLGGLVSLTCLTGMATKVVQCKSNIIRIDIIFPNKPN
jgi:hypothetical protein